MNRRWDWSLRPGLKHVRTWIRTFKDMNIQNNEMNLSDCCTVSFHILTVLINTFCVTQHQAWKQWRRTCACKTILRCTCGFLLRSKFVVKEQIRCKMEEMYLTKPFHKTTCCILLYIYHVYCGISKMSLSLLIITKRIQKPVSQCLNFTGLNGFQQINKLQALKSFISPKPCIFSVLKWKKISLENTK